MVREQFTHNFSNLKQAHFSTGLPTNDEVVKVKPTLKHDMTLTISRLR